MGWKLANADQENFLLVSGSKDHGFPVCGSVYDEVEAAWVHQFLSSAPGPVHPDDKPPLPTAPLSGTKTGMMYLALRIV